MKNRRSLLFAVAVAAAITALTAITALSAMAWAQGTQYPITIIPIGRGPYTLPGGLPDALGQDRDHGDGEDLAESFRSAWFARP